LFNAGQEDIFTPIDLSGTASVELHH
jgi:hypothetical protein